MGKHFPLFRRDLLRVQRDDNALAAEFFRAFANQLRPRQRRGVDADFIRTCPQHRVHVVHGPDAAADGQGYEALVCCALDYVHHRAAAVRRGGDVEEHHFVRALFVVAHGEFNRIAHVAQAALFGDAKLDAARDFAIVNVETRDDTFGQHRERLNRPGGHEANRIRRVLVRSSASGGSGAA